MAIEKGTLGSRPVNTHVARFRIENRSGSVRVRAEPGTGVEVNGGEIEPQDDGSVLVRGAKGGSKSLDVVVPEGADIVIGTASGSVDVSGDVGIARVACKSGSIRIERANDVDARTHSGSVTIGDCEGECRAVVVSGSVQIDSAGSASVAAVSGSVRLGEVDAAEVKTVSGKIVVGANATGHVRVKSVSGTVEVSVPDERAPATRLKSMSGSIRCDCPQGDDGQIEVKTVSGTIRVICR
jgi:DUF4097 and DUF4098 domain-containing protein YvlB